MWILPWKVSSLPRQSEGSLRRRGPPRRGHVRLGEPEDSEDGLFGPPRQTTSPKRRKAMPRRACDCPRPIFAACLGLFSWPSL